MPSSEKAEDRFVLASEVGRLLAPVSALAEKPTPPTAAEYQLLAAKCRGDDAAWCKEVQRCVTVGNYTLTNELNDLIMGFRRLYSRLEELARPTDGSPEVQQQDLRSHLEKTRQSMLAAIQRIPIDWGPRLLEERTPFTTYLLLRDAIATARRRIHYFDRYLDTDFFDLYLRHVERSIEVRLITTKGKASSATKHGYGVLDVLALSKVAQQEFTNYALLECTPGDLHDRNLRVDDRNFYLGPSISEAGTRPTNFGPADSNPSGHQTLDAIMAKGHPIT